MSRKMHMHHDTVPPEELIAEARRYTIANPVLTRLKEVHRELSAQQYNTIRGQALSGDIEGATKGLETILGRKYTAEGIRVW